MTEVSSLVERLRSEADGSERTREARGYAYAGVGNDKLLREAASAIEALERDACRLRYERDMASEALSSLRAEVLAAIEPWARLADGLSPECPQWTEPAQLDRDALRALGALRDRLLSSVSAAENVEGEAT